MKQCITNVRVVTESSTIEDGFVWIEDGMIHQIGTQAQWSAWMDQESRDIGTSPLRMIDGRGGWLLPGFIDVHVHGGFGADFMDAQSQSLDTITSFHARHGTTAMLATTVTAPHDALEHVILSVRDYQHSGMPYAHLLGVHLEGPFISPKWPGAQNPNHIVLPQVAWLKDWHEQYPELVRLVTLAPEREGALEMVGWLADHQIVAACGHTDATLAEMQAARRVGLTHAVHAYNAMRGLHHREPGVVGAILTDPAISVEVIADGHHVHPAAIELLVRSKPPHQLMLITDAMAAAGLGDGDYELGGLPVTVQHRVARLANQSTLAGSTLTMLDAFRYMVNTIGVAVADASRMASGNPARLLRVDQRIGVIAHHKQADLILLDANLDIQHIWIRGKQMASDMFTL